MGRAVFNSLCSLRSTRFYGSAIVFKEALKFFSYRVRNLCLNTLSQLHLIHGLYLSRYNYLKHEPDRFAGVARVLRLTSMYDRVHR